MAKAAIPSYRPSEPRGWPRRTAQEQEDQFSGLEQDDCEEEEERKRAGEWQGEAHGTGNLPPFDMFPRSSETKFERGGMRAYSQEEALSQLDGLACFCHTKLI